MENCSMNKEEGQVNVAKYLQCVKAVQRIKDEWHAWDPDYKYAVVIHLLAVHRSITDDALQIGLMPLFDSVERIYEEWVYYFDAAMKEVYSARSTKEDPFTGSY